MDTKMDEKDAVLRPEYEARSAATQQEINKLGSKLDALLLKIDSLDRKVDYKINALNGKINSIRTEGWKYVATTLISFLTGGGAITLIEFILKGNK